MSRGVWRVHVIEGVGDPPCIDPPCMWGSDELHVGMSIEGVGDIPWMELLVVAVRACEEAVEAAPEAAVMQPSGSSTTGTTPLQDKLARFIHSSGCILVVRRNLRFLLSLEMFCPKMLNILN